METTPQSSVSEKLNFHLGVPGAILVGALMVSLSIIYVGNGGNFSLFKAAAGPAVVSATPEPIKDPSTLFGPTDPIEGSSNAKVTVVEFSDFQCPFCRAFFEDTYGLLKKQYIDTGKVRLVYRDYPLSFHPAAKPAALAAQCANDQGKFWEFHDKVFTEQGKQGTGTITFGATELKLWASQIGLNMAQFNSCFDSSAHLADVEADTKAGQQFGVTGTPSFFINGRLIVGAQPFSAFQTAIDAELKK